MGAAFSALGINAGNLFVSTICLIIAYLIIARFIVGPVQKVASERQAVIDSGMENARKSKQMIADAEGIKVLTIPSFELSRGRGGPRCMSCPVNRDDL